jgi:S-adenosylmethionine:tRNA ribosyltransferase-isomerase
MDSENFNIPAKTADVVNEAKRNKKKVCAVGTTVMRAIESSVSANRMLNPATGWTDKFIYPPYDFSVANCMLTNFHMPKSTLMMMVSAFVDFDLLMKAYKEAVKENYRFFCYGDVMLIL